MIQDKIDDANAVVAPPQPPPPQKQLGTVGNNTISEIHKRLLKDALLKSLCASSPTSPQKSHGGALLSGGAAGGVHHGEKQHQQHQTQLQEPKSTPETDAPDKKKNSVIHIFKPDEAISRCFIEFSPLKQEQIPDPAIAANTVVFVASSIRALKENEDDRLVATELTFKDIDNGGGEGIEKDDQNHTQKSKRLRITVFKRAYAFNIHIVFLVLEAMKRLYFPSSPDVSVLYQQETTSSSSSSSTTTAAPAPPIVDSCDESEFKLRAIAQYTVEALIAHEKLVNFGIIVDSEYDVEKKIDDNTNGDNNDDNEDDEDDNGDSYKQHITCTIDIHATPQAMETALLTATPAHQLLTKQERDTLINDLVFFISTSFTWINLPDDIDMKDLVGAFFNFVKNTGKLTFLEPNTLAALHTVIHVIFYAYFYDILHFLPLAKNPCAHVMEDKELTKLAKERAAIFAHAIVAAMEEASFISSPSSAIA